MSDMALLLPRTFTVTEYRRMADLGVLASDERVELLDGIIVKMSPIGRRHLHRHGRIVRYLNEAVHSHASVLGQASFRLDEKNEPQPDIAILAPRPYEQEDRDPVPEEFFAFIELAETSVDKDTGPKLHLYARSGIADYLVVDLERNILFHYSLPTGGEYKRATQLTYGESFTLTRLPNVDLESDPFLKPR
jgi:Uma2 family endonuclease